MTLLTICLAKISRYHRYVKGSTSLETFFPLKEEDESVNIGLNLIDELIVFHTVNFFDLD